jgi:sugar phosphate permease
MEHHYGWRSAFFVAGLPGLLAAWLVLALPDPPRGAQDTVQPAQRATAPARASTVDDAMLVYSGLLQRPPYVLIVLGYAAYTFALGGLAFWMPSFLEQVRGVPAQEATTGFGLIVVVTGFLGTFLGGWLSDRMLRFSRQAYLWLSGLTTLLAVPFVCVALTATDSAVFYPALVAAELLLFMSTGPINAAIVNGVSPLERASAVALSMFLIHLLGDVPSPTLIGWLADRYSLGSAVLLVPVAVVVAGVLWIQAARVSARTPLIAVGTA